MSTSAKPRLRKNRPPLTLEAHGVEVEDPTVIARAFAVLLQPRAEERSTSPAATPPEVRP